MSQPDPRLAALRTFRAWLEKKIRERDQAAKVHGQTWSDYAQIYRNALAEFDRLGLLPEQEKTL